MKYLIPAVTLLCATSLVSLHAAEPLKHPVKPLLWKIEGGNLKKPSYFFGTIHLGGGALNKLHPAAQKAFDNSDILLTEIPLDMISQLKITPKLLRDDDKTLSESIGPDLSRKLDDELQIINPALNSKPFQNLRTWTIAMTLPMLKAQLTGNTAIDQKLWDLAKDNKKKTGALESVDFQVGLFGGFTEDEQVQLLSETLRLMRNHRANGKDSLKELTDAYIQGDAALLEQLIEQSSKEMLEGEHKELGKKLYDKLLTERDKTMAETIQQRLKQSPDTVHFFAAGTAHFSGDPSIRTHLEKAGYTISRIEK